MAKFVSCLKKGVGGRLIGQVIRPALLAPMPGFFFYTIYAIVCFFGNAKMYFSVEFGILTKGPTLLQSTTSVSDEHLYLFIDYTMVMHFSFSSYPEPKLAAPKIMQHSTAISIAFPI